ncbi:MAG: amidohydrolase family protein [Pseudomonadota bacterium]
MDEDIGFIDAHHHFWDLDRLYYPFLQDVPPHPFFLGDQRPLAKTFLPDDYREAAKNHRVVGTVHVEAECDRAMQLQETEWLSALNAQFGLPNAIVAHVWFDDPAVEAKLGAHAEWRLFRGIRSKPVTASRPDEDVRGVRRSMQDPRWIAGFRRLADFNLSWDLRVPYWHLEEAARLAADHPDIPVVLNHTGFPWDRSEAGLARWRTGMRALARVDHVSVKLSCVCVPGAPWTLGAHRDVILEAIDLFGVSRCMFASNVPPDTLQVDYDSMLTAYKAMVADLSFSDRQRLFHDNAKAFYRMELE